jgi:DNA-binding transcriptional regulator YiaG
LSGRKDKIKMDRTARFNALKAKYQLSNMAVALRFGISVRTVESWSSGARKPKEYTLVMMEKPLKHLEGEKNNEKNVQVGM